jgi:hypothetical protein
MRWIQGFINPGTLYLPRPDGRGKYLCTRHAFMKYITNRRKLLISNNAGNVDAKDESSCSQAIRTRRFTTLLTGVMCATRTNTLILGQSLILTIKTSFSKQNMHVILR